MRQFLTTLMLIPLCGLLLSGQSADSTELARRSSTTSRVENLSTRLRFHDSAGAEQYQSTRDSLTSEINTSIDGYLHAVAPATANARAVADDLKHVLGGHAYDPEYSGIPFSLVTDLASGRVLFVGYMLVRGGDAVNDSYDSLRAYVVQDGQFSLAATTGNDFAGHGLFVAEVHSPVPNEVWMLVWGPQFGFNGTRVRMRLYAYDENRFRTVWEPQDVLNATIHISADGFSVEHLDEKNYFVDRHPPYYVRDEYGLTSDGPRQRASVYLPE